MRKTTENGRMGGRAGRISGMGIGLHGASSPSCSGAQGLAPVAARPTRLGTPFERDVRRMKNTTRRNGLGVVGAACLLGLLLPSAAFAQAIPNTNIVERKPEARPTRFAAVEREDGGNRDALERETLAALQKARSPKQDADLARADVPARKSAYLRRVLDRNGDNRLRTELSHLTSEALARGESNAGLQEFMTAHVATDERHEVRNEARAGRLKGQNAEDKARQTSRKDENRDDYLAEKHERQKEQRDSRKVEREEEKKGEDKDKKDEKRAEDSKERLDERKDVKDEAKKEQKEERTKELRDEKQREQTDERRTSTKP